MKNGLAWFFQLAQSLWGSQELKFKDAACTFCFEKIGRGKKAGENIKWQNLLEFIVIKIEIS